ncbi:anthranilate synthase component I family protein [Halostagnicola sp. A-GB9-2]|uniref:anthranilate synthase component I family protein n=1 Tax=Halostagnicola sp. A-GB9-2 TaxID=3048066 RepID=UPI0024BF8B95|nr:anthranilate synthase component I family protein [Halostagnicola sp. A-GB9-2]MDJ1434350.1 anthranilate synthase component I family protein [Halostagnicola sp. A-GB9-2]
MTEPAVKTDVETFASVAENAPSNARVPVEVRVVVSDTFDAYRNARDGAGGFYLETSGGQDGWGYFGIEPIERVRIDTEDVFREDSDSSPSLAAIDELLEREQLVRGHCNVPYPCGAFGWLSYDVARELEDLPTTTRNERRLPHLQLGVFDCVAAWRQPCDGEVTLHVTACPVVKDDPRAAYERGREKAVALAEDATTGSSDISMPTSAAKSASFESSCGPQGFADRVRTVKEHVRNGDTFQANVSHRLTAPANVHPVEAFSALRAVNPAPYSGLLEYPGVDLVSASPELLLEVRDDRVATEPIAGTRPRGETQEKDESLETELRADEKERAEHAMMVDLERNDLGKVCEYGTIDVTEYRRIDRYSEVMHLVSLIEGKRRAETSIADAIGAVFPGGTITGAPKPRTMEIIDEVEHTCRGPYTGSIAVLGFDDRATLNIIIRTLVRHEDEYHLRVGAGIVHDSDPGSEYYETLDKAAALITAIDTALDESGSFDVETPTGTLEDVK